MRFGGCECDITVIWCCFELFEEMQMWVVGVHYVKINVGNNVCSQNGIIDLESQHKYKRLVSDRIRRGCRC